MSGLVANAVTLVHTTVATSWTDTIPEGWGYSYTLTAVDINGNESAPEGPGAVTGIDNRRVSSTVALHQNVPNPFNPTTVIHYDIPGNGVKVSLQIFDVGGRLVRTLVNDEQSAGKKTSRWDGTDSNGNLAGSGVYFYRLTAGNRTLTKKMVLLK